jgi:hypothetical protein
LFKKLAVVASFAIYCAVAVFLDPPGSYYIIGGEDQCSQSPNL